MFWRKVELPIEQRDNLLRVSLAAKDEIIAAWKDRGDKYATHNDQLQNDLYRMHSLVAGLLEQKDGGSEFKQLLTKALESRRG